jgi:heme-degrading monooxygenase HmoA
MVMRLWRGWTAPADAAAYAGYLQATIFPELRRLDGHLGGEILRRDQGREVEFLVCTRWRTREHIRAFAGEAIEVAVISPEAERLLSRSDKVVAHYDVLDGV